MTAHPKKSESEVRDALRELLENIVTPEHPWFDPKKALDETEQKIEALYNQRMEKLLGENDDTAVSAKMDTITYYKNIGRNKLRQEIRTRAGINKKEEV